MMIRGPNAGGKTLARKGLGIAALLAQAGIPVPAACTVHRQQWLRHHLSRPLAVPPTGPGNARQEPSSRTSRDKPRTAPHLR